jgi:MerR family redox-sensitive transcriptional activator SoxR
MDPRELLSMGEVTRRSGFAASAIRYYEAEGLVEAHRSSSGQRRFERNVLRRLGFIRAASNVGLSIEEIRAELGRLPDNRTPNKADWHRISKHWGRRLDEQIAALERLKRGLDSCIGCGCLSLRSCAFSNPGDVVGERGQGAQLLPDTLRRPHPTRRPPSA